MSSLALKLKATTLALSHCAGSDGMMLSRIILQLLEDERSRYDGLLAAASTVCRLDWSDNDPDAVETIDHLRAEIASLDAA